MEARAEGRAQDYHRWMRRSRAAGASGILGQEGPPTPWASSSDALIKELDSGWVRGTRAALVAGLTAVGSPAGTAVGGVLVFRLLTFWLPSVPGAWAFKRLRSRGLV